MFTLTQNLIVLANDSPILPFWLVLLNFHKPIKLVTHLKLKNNKEKDLDHQILQSIY
jgi:hypothetical protein